MKRIVTILLACLLIQLSAISQSKLGINGKTVVAISEEQLRKANQLFDEGLMFKEFNDSLISEVRKQQGYILILGKQNAGKSAEIGLLKTNLNLCNEVNKEKESQMVLLNKTIKAEQAKKAKNLFVGAGAGIVISTIVVVLTGLHK